MTSAVQQSLFVLEHYPHIALEASYRAQFTQLSDITLQQLFDLPYHQRRAVVEKDPFIDIFLGQSRVYKRTSKILLFAFCPDIGRFLEPIEGHFAVRLPGGFSNVLAVKLAVLYMDQSLLNIAFRNAPWKVGGDVAASIYLAEIFAFIGMSEAARKVEIAILSRLRELPLRIEDIRAIWARENALYPSKYAEAMADNIITFLCVPRIELFLLEHDSEPENTYGQRIKRKLQQMAETYPDTVR